MEFKTIALTNPHGSSVEVRFLRATRVVPLPMVGFGPIYVETDYGRELVHGGTFGEGAGPLLVSPDRSVAVIETWFEGGQIGEIEIDLLNPRPIYRRGASLDRDNWEEYEWRSECYGY